MPIDLACTGCRRRLSIRDEFANRQVRCPACGALVTAAPPAPPPEGALLPGFVGPFFTPPVPFTPATPSIEWEDATRPPRLGALVGAWRGVFFSPGGFFSSLSSQGLVSRALLAGLPWLIAGAVANAAQWHWFSAWITSHLPNEVAQALGNLGTAGDLRRQFLYEAMGFALYPLALHAGVALFGGKGVRQSFRIYYYSLVARALDLAPFGPLVSWVYLLILLYLGIRNLHGLPEGRSLGALVVALLIATLCIAMVMGCMMLGSEVSLPAIR